MSVRLFSCFLTMAIGVSLLAGCTARDKAVEFSKTGIAYYCNADDATRAALREQLTTSKGPLVQVNCENLE